MKLKNNNFGYEIYIWILLFWVYINYYICLGLYLILQGNIGMNIYIFGNIFVLEFVEEYRYN